jgi:dTDP-glucose 4,6-dehydratase
MVDYLLKKTPLDLVILDGLTYAGNLNRITDLQSYKENPGRLTFIYHNLRSPINELVAERIGAVDYIIHLAANSSVEYTLKHPEESVLDNVMATVNILEFARTQKSLKLINYFSTDEVYGPVMKPGDGFEESAPHRPSNPYAAGKAAGEDYCYAYFTSYNVPVFITNSMNILGYDQHPEKFIPTVIRAVGEGSTVPIYASPDLAVAGSRYWIFAEDVAAAIWFLLSRAAPGQKYHIVGEWSDNLALAQRIADIMGRPLKYEMVNFHESRPGHDMHYGLTDTKMWRMGWTRGGSLVKGLRKILGVK